jgi:hypothetical protein
LLHPLGIPEDVQQAKDGVELLRAFAADGQLHVVLTWDAWPDAKSWGVLLADLAKHIANARAQELGEPAASALADIRLAFEEHWGWDAASVDGSVSSDDA